MSAGALVHVVDVLRYDLDVVIPFQLGNGVVAGIGLPLEQLAAPFVIELDDRRAVAYERFGRAYILDAIVWPTARPSRGTWLCRCRRLRLRR